MKTKDDLIYWSQKLAHAETLYGEKKVSMRKVVLAMIDIYLDQYLDQKKMGLDVLETIPG